MTATLIIILLILLNAIFVAAEFAIVGVPRVVIERRASRGDRLAMRIRRVLNEPRLLDRYVATAQLGITAASLGLGMYGEHALADWLAVQLEMLGTSRWIAAHALASVIAISILTFFHIVVGEMVPKSLALQSAERTVLRIAPIMLIVEGIFMPFIFILNLIGNGFLRLLGIRRSESSSEHIHTPEELQFIVEESTEGGMLKQEAATVIQELFEFSDLTAGEVMVPRVRVTGVPAESDENKLAEVVRSSKHTRYPVYTDNLDHIVGMIHVKDLLNCLMDGRSLKTATLRPVAYVPETARLDVVLETLNAAETEMAVVMDEHGGTAGIVMVEDIFEEVVGDIEEELTARPECYEDASGLLHVDGTVRLEDLSERIDEELEHEEVDTVSGLVLALLNRPPTIGDVVEYDHVRFEVTSIEGHGVRECIVSVLPREGIEPEVA